MLTNDLAIHLMENMNKGFHLDAYLDEIYSTFPEAERRPLIGLTANYSDIDATIRSVYYRGHTAYYSARCRQACGCQYA